MHSVALPLLEIILASVILAISTQMPIEAKLPNYIRTI